MYVRLKELIFNKIMKYLLKYNHNVIYESFSKFADISVRNILHTLYASHLSKMLYQHNFLLIYSYADTTFGDSTYSGCKKSIKIYAISSFILCPTCDLHIYILRYKGICA